MPFPRFPRAAPEALVLAVAFPVLAVNPAYAPGASVGLGSANVTIETGDVAMIAVVVAMFLSARRFGPDPLRHAWSVLLPAAGLVLAVLLATALGPQLSEGYPLATKAVSAGKFVEYALLALAVPLIVRTADDVRLVVTFVVATGVAATTWGVLQFIGLLPNFDDVPAGRRMPSFAGYHDFAILSGLTLALAIGAVALGHPRGMRSCVWLVSVSGVIGMIVAGALSAVLAVLLGIAFAVVAAVVKKVLTRGRLAALAAIALVLLAGSSVMRSGDAADFIGFLGSDTNESASGVESYSQRTVLAYIGLRIFLDNPVTGVGWQGSELYLNAAPYLDDARKRFPEVTEEALPLEEHPWGVQNAYVQAAADMGVAGLVLIVWLVLATIARSACATLLPGRAAAAPIALAVAVGALVCGFEWAALGLVAGGPATAFIWFTIGAAVAAGSRATAGPRAAAATSVVSP